MREHLKVASALANLLDNQFNFGGFRFGISALIDLIPGIGDFIDASLSLYIVWIAIEMRAPINIIIRMIGNILVNFAIGIIPLVGDVVYFTRKVNLKNLELLKNYTDPNVR